MATYHNLAQVKDALQIDSFADLPMDKIGELASLFGSIDKEVLLELVRNFSQFKELATEVLDRLNDTYQTTLDKGSQSNQSVMDACRSLLDTLQTQINAESTSPEDKRYFVEKSFEVIEKMSEKDTEQKQWHAGMFGTACKVVFGVLGVTVALLFAGGGNHSDPK